MSLQSELKYMQEQVEEWRRRVRQQSNKTSKMYRQNRDARKAFLEEFPQCMCCMRRSTEVHEIANGPSRQLAFVNRCAWLAVCTDCNQNELTDKKRWPIARQLAVKASEDPVYFDRVAVNRMRGRSDDAITFAEVAQWLVWS